MPATFRMHYLVPAPAGPIVSGPGPVLPPEVASGLAIEDPSRASLPTVGRGGRFAIACDSKLRLSDVDRGTGEPYLVECPKCKATQIFKDTWRPHPRLAASHDEAETEHNPIVSGGCC